MATKHSYWNKKINKVVNWCEKNGVQVIFINPKTKEENNNIYDPKNDTISISRKQKIDQQFYSLLHECGHFILLREMKTYKKTFPFVFAAVIKKFPTKSNRSVSFKMDLLDEEFEAWKKGEVLAQKLKIPLNSTQYKKSMLKSLKTYVDWVFISSKQKKTI